MCILPICGLIRSVLQYRLHMHDGYRKGPLLSYGVHTEDWRGKICVGPTISWPGGLENLRRVQASETEKLLVMTQKVKSDRY